MSEALQTIIIAIPVVFITSFVELLKLLGMPSKYAQLMAFLLAIILGILFYWNASLTNTIVGILMYGLAAVGLWEVGGKKVVPKEEAEAPIVSEN